MKYRCKCKNPPAMFMLHDDLWKQIANGEEYLCLSCIEKGLGRELHSNDLKDVPLSWDIRIVLKRKEALGQEE